MTDRELHAEGAVCKQMRSQKRSSKITSGRDCRTPVTPPSPGARSSSG